MTNLPRLIDIPTAKKQMAAIGLRPRATSVMIDWIREYNLGHKVGGNWVLIEEKFHRFLMGEDVREENNEKG